MLTRCFSTSFLGFEARLVRLNRSGGGWGRGAQPPPPPHLQTPCSHDGCQQVSWALKHALHGLKQLLITRCFSPSFLGCEARLVRLKRSGGGWGGGPQPAAPPPPPPNKFLWALKHALHGLKKSGGVGGGGGGAQPPPFNLQTQCSHDVSQLVSWALKHAWYGLKDKEARGVGGGGGGGRSPFRSKREVYLGHSSRIFRI